MSRFRVEVAGDQVLVEVARTTAVNVSIYNAGRIVDDYTVSVAHFPEDWTTVTPRNVSLLPDTPGEVTVSLQPPADARLAAGESVLGIVVRSQRYPDEVVVEELRVSVAETSGATLEVQPVALTGKRRGAFLLQINNTGNTPLALRLAGSEPSGAADVAIEEPQITVPAFGSRKVHAVVSAPRPLHGDDVQRLVTFTAAGEDVELTSTATFTQRPLVTAGVRRAAAGAVPLAIAAAAFLPGLIGGDDDPQAVATAGPTPVAAVATTPPEPTATPTPEPTTFPLPTEAPPTAPLPTVVPPPLPPSTAPPETESTPSPTPLPPLRERVEAAGLPGQLLDDCLRYEASSVVVGAQRTDGFPVTDVGGEPIAVLPSGEEADAVAAIARRHEARCFLGRQDTQGDVVDYWLPDAPAPDGAPPGECIDYDPIVVNVEAAEDRFALTSGERTLAAGMTERNALLAAEYARAHARRCTIGDVDAGAFVSYWE